MRIAKPNRFISFNYAGLSRCVVLSPEAIEYLYITRDHVYVFVDPNIDIGDSPFCLVRGSGIYNVSSDWARFSLYLRYCEPHFENCLRFYIDHERNEREHVGLIKC